MSARAPDQFTTTDGTLIGSGSYFTFQPYPLTLQTTLTGVTNALLFRNGLLVDEYQDYATGRGYFFALLAGQYLIDTFTSQMYRGGGATKLRPRECGLTFTGDNKHLRLSPMGPSVLTTVPFMLFRNGQLLTEGADYTVTNHSWIVLEDDQAILDGDTVLALIAMGGVSCSTFAGTITGVIDGVNPVFSLPAPFSTAMLFRNGQLLTVGQDYTHLGSQQVVLIGDEIPQSGDILTAQSFATGGPVQTSTVDGSLFYPTAVRSIAFRNGIFMTQPIDAVTSGNRVALQLPLG